MHTGMCKLLGGRGRGRGEGGDVGSQVLLNVWASAWTIGQMGWSGQALLRLVCCCCLPPRQVQSPGCSRLLAPHCSRLCQMAQLCFRLHNPLPTLKRYQAGLFIADSGCQLGNQACLCLVLIPFLSTSQHLCLRSHDEGRATPARPAMDECHNTCAGCRNINARAVNTCRVSIWPMKRSSIQGHAVTT